MYQKKIDFARLRVLVVENHALMRRLLGEMLRGFGVNHVQFARDVPSSVDLVYGEPFDVVILDFFLGELDGADFAKLIRHDDHCLNREVPILLITGMPDHHKVMKVLDAGINSMLAKPIAPKDFYHRIHMMLANPRPFVITHDYVGPMRQRKHASRAKRPTSANLTALALTKSRREPPNPVFEDGILL